MYTSAIFCGYVAFVAIATSSSMADVSSWWPRDNFDIIKDKMDKINSANCDDVSVDELRLPKETFTDPPTFQYIKNGAVKNNRQALIPHHNLALSRALTLSFIYGKDNNEWPYDAFDEQPHMLYYYFGASADVSADAKIAGSGIFFGKNLYYPNWIPSMYFNQTMLFGTRAFKLDTGCSDMPKLDSTEGNACVKMPDVLSVTDYSAGTNRDYTTREYKHNPWYFLYLPDNQKISLDDLALCKNDWYNIDWSNMNPGNKICNHTIDRDRKQLQTVKIQYNTQTERVNFRGPAIDTSPRDFQPVRWTEPYFDCGRSQKWIVTAVSPIVDFLARYTAFTYIRRYTFSGVSTEDAFFEDIDIDQCPGSEDNYFQGTAKCKSTTTCKPLAGFGFNRGGYQCVCREGLVYPKGQDVPFTGVDIESTTKEEYEEGFDCVAQNREETGKGETLQNVKTEDALDKSRRFIPWHSFDRRFTNVPDSFDTPKRDKFDILMKMKSSVGTPDCYFFNRDEFTLGEEIFEQNSHMKLHSTIAARQAFFLSTYLQNTRPNQTPMGPYNEWGYREPISWEDIYLHIDHVIGETVGTVLANPTVYANGIYFDEGRFMNNEGETISLVAPRSKVNTQTNVVETVDLSNLTIPIYTDQDWFRGLKMRWENGQNLKRNIQNVEERADKDGFVMRLHIRSPMETLYADVDDGTWVGPSLDCGSDAELTAKFIMPFFGLSNQSRQLEFFGAVVIESLLENIDINQCPNEYHSTDPFSNTALCDYSSSKCEAYRGHGFQKGGYACLCNNGDIVDGFDLEMEYAKMKEGSSNRFEKLRQRCEYMVEL